MVFKEGARVVVTSSSSRLATSSSASLSKTVSKWCFSSDSTAPVAILVKALMPMGRRLEPAMLREETTRAIRGTTRRENRRGRITKGRRGRSKNTRKIGRTIGRAMGA